MFDTLLKVLGVKKFDHSIAKFAEGIVAFKKAGKWGVFSLEAEGVVIRFEYDEIKRLYCSNGEVHQHHFLVRQDKNWGLFCIKESRLLIPVQYQDISMFGEVHIVYRHGEGPAGGIYDIKNGELILETQYSSFSSLGAFPGFIIVSKEDKQGVFSLKERRLVVPVSYYHIYGYWDEQFLRIATANSKDHKRRVGLYLYERDILVKPTFKYIEPPAGYGFVKDIGAVPFYSKSPQEGQSLYGLISLETGEVLLEATYKKITPKTKNIFELLEKKSSAVQIFDSATGSTV